MFKNHVPLLEMGYTVVCKNGNENINHINAIKSLLTEFNENDSYTLSEQYLYNGFCSNFPDIQCFH